MTCARLSVWGDHSELALPLRPLARLAQDEESGLRGGEARAGREWAAR